MKLESLRNVTSLIINVKQRSVKCAPDTIFITVIFVLFCLTGYCQSTKQLVEQGDNFYGKKNYKKALESYQSALDTNPDDAAINLKVGLSYLYSETKSKAAKFISKAYRLNPNINDQIDYHLGLAF